MPPSSFSEILNVQAGLEDQVGEIYFVLAATFADNPELQDLWSSMALEERGHAALLRSLSKGVQAGLLQMKPSVLPLNSLNSLRTQLAEYRQQVEAGVTLEQALRISWEIEGSDLNFMWELLVSISNLAELSIFTEMEGQDKHLMPLRQAIQKYATDEGLRRKARFLA